MDSHISLTPTARLLGYAGLLPQIICFALVWVDNPYRYTALFMGYVYPAAIFSFLGGVWWGQAIARSGHASAGVYIVAVIPSLIAAALFIPYNEGWEWPGPAMLYLGAFILLSPLVDRGLGFAKPDFLRLRWHLSVGLGALTIALGVLAMQVMKPTLPDLEVINPHAASPQSDTPHRALPEGHPPIERKGLPENERQAI